MLERIAQAIFNFALVLARFHVNEIDDHQTAQIAQAKLARNFVCRFAVGAKRGLLNVMSFGGTRGVDVDRDQGFGMVDDDGATGGQRYIAAISRLDLVFDLEARKQGNVVFVQLDLADIRRHHRRHKRLGLLKNFLGIDEDFADIRLEQIADRTYHQARLEINEFRPFYFAARAFNGFPELHQIIHVPL